MKKTVIWVCTSFFFLTACSVSKGQIVTRSDDNATVVKELFTSGIKAFNSHNLKEFLGQFDDEIQMYSPTGWIIGKSEVKKRFEDTFDKFPSVRMEIEDLKSTAVNSITVITTFKWRVFPMGKGPAFHGVGSGIYIKRKGKWVEVLEHETVTSVDKGLK